MSAEPSGAPPVRQSFTASSGLMSFSRSDVKRPPVVRRGGHSTNTQFPFDVPVIGWKSKFDAAEMDQARLQTVICHAGWLFKRAQVTLDSKRWFVLENNRLYSYIRQDYLKKEDGQSDEDPFPPSIRAVIDLDYCQIKVMTKQRMLLEVECKVGACWSKKGNIFSDLGSGLSGSTKIFTFYAEDDTSFQSWVDALARVEAYKKLKYQLHSSGQIAREPLTLWDLPRESLLRIFCRMPDDKPEFKFFEKKWPALREEDVMFYLRVVLLLNGSHQRAMDRHKQVALQEWEVNNSWKEVYEHITLNKLTSEPVIEVEYPKIEMKLPSENSKLAIKVKERMEIFADYKALPRILLRSLKELQELKVERPTAELRIEDWFLQVDPFVDKLTAAQATLMKDQRPRARGMNHALPVIVESEEDVEMAKLHMDRAVEIADGLLVHLGSALMLEDGPVCEKGIISNLRHTVFKIIQAQKEVDLRQNEHMAQESASFLAALESQTAIDDLDENGNPIHLARKVSKDSAPAPELFSDWEGGVVAVEPLSVVSFFSKIHGLIKALHRHELELQSYFERICENLLKKDKPSDDAKGFRASTMKKEVDVQYLPVNGHVQTVAFRSLKSKNGEAARTDAIVQKISSFITVGSFSAHALKFKQSKGYDGELLKLSKIVQSFDTNLELIQGTSQLWLNAVSGDEASCTELDKFGFDDLDSSFGVNNAAIAGNRDAKLKKQLDVLVSRIWKVFVAGAKSDCCIPSIVKARADCQKRRSVSISQALSAFAEVIMSQIKTFYHGSCPDFWHILDLVGAFTLTVSCLVSVFHDEMGMLDDTYNACRWVIDRRLMIRLKLMPANLQYEHDSGFFWTLCEDSDSTGLKSSRNNREEASSYNMLFRSFPCEKSQNSGATCFCRACRSHPLPQWDERRSDEEFPADFHKYRAKAAPSDFLQPVLVIHVRKKYWDKIPPFVLDPSDPTHLRYDYPLFPIFNNVGINENQRRAASMHPTNFLMQNRVNSDAAAVFSNIIEAVEINARALSPNPSSILRSSIHCDAQEYAAASQPSSPSVRPASTPIFRHASSRMSESSFDETLLVFKKRRPSPKSVWSVPSGATHPTEDPAPILNKDDEAMISAIRWPLHFSDPIVGRIDGQQLLERLKAQIVDNCKKCRDACYNTRKVTKEMLRKLQQHAQMGEERQSYSIPDDAEVLRETSAASSVTKDSAKDLQTNLEEPPIDELEVIGDISRSKLASGRIVMCKSAKDRTSMYVTYEECRFLIEEHDHRDSNGTRKEFMDLVQRMRTDGTRIHNVRKNVHTSTYAFNKVQGLFLPANYKPPASRMAWGVQS